MDYWMIVSKMMVHMKFHSIEIPIMTLHESLAVTCGKKRFPGIMLV